MIIGIGTDLCDIRRIEKTLERFQDRFKSRIFLESERNKADNQPNPAATYAKFFAAKESCSKALGTGFRQGVSWKNFEVRNLDTGQPYLILSGAALRRLKSLTPQNMKSAINLSLTDEFPLANAVVIISAQKSKIT